MSTSQSELNSVAEAAAVASERCRTAPARERAGWLRAVADRLDAHADEIVTIADEETHLGVQRLRGEVARTTGQLRLFADAIIEGSYAEAIIDTSAPDATPPRPDLRRMLRAIGPVAVFSASNFPFAFSVAGGDTASALAAGCPVVVKAHSGHERLSLRTAQLVSDALSDAGAPEGIFGVVVGREAGTALVQHPAITAVGFTGSVGGGRALFDLATSRPDPIPFYGELGSINPVVVTANAVQARGDELASGLVQSFTLGVGQFCTKPGVVFYPAGSGFAAAVATAAASAQGGTMLTHRIAEEFSSKLSEVAASGGVRVAFGEVAQGGDACTPVVIETDAAAVLASPDALLNETFGPVTLLVAYGTREELRAAIDVLPGSLTGTLHAEADDDVAEIVDSLSRHVGRILFSGWPTGVAVTWSQHHGGPWPATTSLHSSVGVTAIRRFLRPIAYQDAPQGLLPAELRDDNPLGIPRRVDGELVTAQA